MIRAGDLRHRVTIQQATVTRNEFGEPVETWQDLATVWAEVVDLSGREFIEARQAPASEVTTRVRIRYRAGIEPTMRVLHGARVLEIVAVLEPEGRRRELHLMCREVRSGGESS